MSVFLSSYLCPRVDIVIPLDKSFNNQNSNSSRASRARHGNSRTPRASFFIVRSHGLLGLPEESPLSSVYGNCKLKLSKSFDSCSSLNFYDAGSCQSRQILTFRVGIRGFCSAVVARAVVASTDIEEKLSAAEEVKELLEEISKEKEREYLLRRNRDKEIGVAERKFMMLRRRQVKIESEAWEQAAKEYRELLDDMCAHKLAPNLPYIKSLFLGWFEPLRDAIANEQAMYRSGKNRASHAPFLDQLPSEMMAVITMHKLMGLLMTGGEHGVARVIQAALCVGDAIEQEVVRYNFAIPVLFYT